MKLYAYWCPVTSDSVGIALNGKGTSRESVGVDLMARAQKSADCRELNPVPGGSSLTLDDCTALTQSRAILEWLESAFADLAELPADPVAA